MDPQAAADQATDPTLPLAERADAADALADWLASGGWLPEWPGRPADLSAAAARGWTVSACRLLATEAEARHG